MRNRPEIAENKHCRLVTSGRHLKSKSVLRLNRDELIQCSAFIAIHLVCLAVIPVGWSHLAFGSAIGAYLVGMFAITTLNNRYLWDLLPVPKKAFFRERRRRRA